MRRVIPGQEKRIGEPPPGPCQIRSARCGSAAALPKIGRYAEFLNSRGRSQPLSRAAIQDSGRQPLCSAQNTPATLLGLFPAPVQCTKKARQGSQGAIVGLSAPRFTQGREDEQAPGCIITHRLAILCAIAHIPRCARNGCPFPGTTAPAVRPISASE